MAVTVAMQVTRLPTVAVVGEQVMAVVDLDLLTACVVLAADAAKFAPAAEVKAAATGCEATVMADEVYVAWPATRVTADPTGLPSTENWTVPVGVPAVAVTVAVQTTCWPKTVVFGVQEMPVVGGVRGTAFTCWVTVGDVDALNRASPP